MTLIFCDFLLIVGGALLFDDDGGASIASGLSFVELSMMSMMMTMSISSQQQFVVKD